MKNDELQFITENCCSLCGNIWECGDPDDPIPDGACEVDDGEVDKDFDYGSEDCICSDGTYYPCIGKSCWDYRNCKGKEETIIESGEKNTKNVSEKN